MEGEGDERDLEAQRQREEGAEGRCV